MFFDTAVSERQTLIKDLQDVSLTYLAQLKIVGGRAFGSLGLSYGQAMILIFVGRGYTTPAELTELLGVVPSAVSGLITHLEGSGLVERSNNRTDARRVCVALTARGSDANQKLQEAWRDNSSSALHELTDDELQHLIEAARIATRRGLI